MESEALRTFLAVHRAHGFSGAAAVLGRTQPAISRRIALFEAELGAPLFERAAGGVVLSQAGRVLLPHAERVVAVLQDAADAVEALRSGTSGPVTLAAVGTLAGPGLTEVLKRFAGTHPDASLTLRTATSAQVSQLVLRGETTIGLRYFDDPSPDLVCLPMAGERLVVACALDHRLAGGRTPSLADLKADRWLAFPDHFERREAASETLFAQFLVRGVGEIAWTAVDSLTAQKRLVEAGYGLALLPESSLDEELAARTLATIGVDDLAVVHPVFAAVRRNGYLSPASRSLLEMLTSP
jgi:DNA-binding transcriptional LysR family regulator